MVEALSAAVDNIDGFDVRVFGLADNSWRQHEWNGAEPVSLTAVGPLAFGYTPALLRELLNWRPDIVHTHGLWMHHSRSVHQWSKRTGRPYLVSPHGMLEPVALKMSSTKKAVSRFLFQDAALRDACLIHTTSDSETESCRKFGLTQPVSVVPNGVTVPPASHIPEKQGAAQRPAVLSLGRIHPKKGLEQLLGAWALLEQKFPLWDLQIVGPGEANYIQTLKELAAKLNTESVQFRDAVAGMEKFQLLRDAELFALSTLSENFALTVAESLACGTPVISTKGAPWAGLETNRCGWWIDQGVPAMAAALETAMSLSYEQRQVMGSRGRKWMESEFGWEMISQQMAQVYSWIDRKGEPPASVQFVSDDR